MGVLMKKIGNPSAIVERLLDLRKNVEMRRTEKRVLVCGTHMVKDVLDMGHVKAHHLYLSDKGPNYWNRWLQQTHIKQIPASIIPESSIKKISGLESVSEETIIAELALPPNAKFNDVQRVLILDGISDPTNAGVLIRTAGALGWDGVIATNNTVDLYNDKAIRAAQGATFLTKVAQLDWPSVEDIVREQNIVCVAADPRGSRLSSFVKDIRERSKRGVVRLGLILGNEARGLSDQAQIATRARLAIPMAENFDSLNVSVAGGILMQILRAGEEK